MTAEVTASPTTMSVTELKTASTVPTKRAAVSKIYLPELNFLELSLRNVATVNIGLAAGLAVAGFVLFIVLPIIIIPIICCCCVGACASAPRRRRTIVTHTAPVGGPQVTVVSANSSNMMQVCFMHRSIMHM